MCEYVLNVVCVVGGPHACVIVVIVESRVGFVVAEARGAPPLPKLPQG